ncbi:acetylglutamate kinase [Rubrivirga sp.]|uniref:acetylglutamate kinase n=1 Tax=Rubrivirga sp. TaxID=1885344 RepID=UPI003B5158E9
MVKLGGAILADAEALADVWAGVAATGGPVVVVHGGGPQATALARRLGHEPTLVAGRRVTGDLDLEVALYTLRGALNARLVGAARAAGTRAVGVSGADGALVTVTRRPPVEVDGEAVDFGHVGDVEAVDPTLVRTLLGAGFVPVVATVCADAAGALYNVNADTVAFELAAALGASRLDVVTEAGGVRRDPSDPASVLARLTGAEVAAGVAEGWIAGGMRPKLETALAALARGVPSVRVCAPADLGGDGGTVVVP